MGQEWGELAVTSVELVNQIHQAWYVLLNKDILTASYLDLNFISISVMVYSVFVLCVQEL